MFTSTDERIQEYLYQLFSTLDVQFSTKFVKS